VHGVVEFSESLDPLYAYAHRTIWRTVGLWLALVGLSGCLLLVIGLMMIGRPIHYIIDS
jgi:hypothetical protein